MALVPPVANPQLDRIASQFKPCRRRFNGPHTLILITRGEHKAILRGDTRNKQIALINA
jgi:hypothetical protein